MKHTNTLLKSIAVIVLLLPAASIKADWVLDCNSKRAFTWQAVVTDTAGNPIPPGVYPLSYCYYTDSTGGNLIGCCTTMVTVESSVKALNGEKAAPLSTIKAAVNYAQPIWEDTTIPNPEGPDEPDPGPWLSITFNDELISPRTLVTDVPYVGMSRRMYGDMFTTPGRTLIFNRSIPLSGAVNMLGNDSGSVISLFNASDSTMPRMTLLTSDAGAAIMLSDTVGDAVISIDGASGILHVANKANLGPDNTNTGTNAFVAGRSNSASGSYSNVNGGTGNLASGVSATVGGGDHNDAIGDTSVVSGGAGNTAGGVAAAVGGGYRNTANATGATVGGGQDNTAGSDYGTISGGRNNTASGQYATVSGGYDNRAEGHWSTVGGGIHDTSWAPYGGVFSGYHNIGGNDNSDTCAFVGGGSGNFAVGRFCTVGGGRDNTASVEYSIVAGGLDNDATSNYSTVGGGVSNVAAGFSATVSGGYYNYNRGDYSAIPGGANDTISLGANYSMAFGYNVDIDSSNRVVFFTPEWSGRLGINRDDDNGISHPIHVGTDATNGNGAYLSASGVWTSAPGRQFKENSQSLGGEDVLRRIGQLPIESWEYKGTGERHIWPCAEDFHEQFDVGVLKEDGTRDTKYLAAGDIAGVALIGVQELYRITNELQQKSQELDELKGQVAQLQALVESLLIQQNRDNSDNAKLAVSK